MNDNNESGSKDFIKAPDGARNDPEFSHIISLAALKLNKSPLNISANPQECDLLAVRFDLPAIHSLSAQIILSTDPIMMRGKIMANIEQICVASGEILAVNISEDIRIKFIEPPKIDPNDSEIALEDEDCDTMFHNGRDIDIGEAVAQSLYLAIDPFPRAYNAQEILQQAGVISEEEMAQKISDQKRKESPFSALSSIKK